MGNRSAVPRWEGLLDTFFAGEFAHSLDDKGRLAIPVKFRPRFREGAVVTPWPVDCLAIFPANEWGTINAAIAQRPRTDPAVARFQRFFVARAHEAEPDGQGRIVIPQHLRAYAGLGGDAVVVGVSRNLEIWEPGRWRSHLADVERRIADDLADLGI
ncbi:MAG: division/cell wall cluster transcriptional repressor MraZ [Candidatus Limnocylindria bacterium]